LISSMIDASVVDLPEPVGPVTSTSPRGFSDNWWSDDERPNSSSDLISFGIRRNAAPSVSRWKKQLTLKRATPGIEWAKSSCRLISSFFCCSLERIL